MAKQLTTSSIAKGLVIEAGHVTQSAVAFTGGEAYDITISGSLTNTGPATLTGLTNLVASDASNLTLEINESASFNFLTGGPNSGSFIVQTSPDTGNGELQVFTGQGTAVIASQNIPNHIFGIKYSSGSGASEGEISMAVGKRNLTSVGGANQNNFYVSYEPSGILTNAQGELEFFVGEHQNVGYGVLSVYRGGASGLTQTSSFAGYFSSSAFPGQQQYTRPFAISTLSQVNDSNPAFVINKNITDLTTSNFSVDYGGNVTASGNISSSGDVFGVTGSFSHLTGNSPITVGDQVTFQQPITASTSMTVGATNISNPRGDGFMGGGGNYDQDLVFLTHQDFHLVDLGTAGSPLDNIAAQRSTTLASSIFVNGSATDSKFASYVIPCGFKVTKVGVLGNGGTFNVRASSVATNTVQDCLAEGSYVSVTTSAPADTYAGYVGIATSLGGESAIIPSASLSGGLGNYINVDVLGDFRVYGAVIVLERI